MPGIRVATTAPEKMGKAAYVAYHRARGAEYPEADWRGLDESARQPWIEAAVSVVRVTEVKVPIAIELMRLEPGLAEKLVMHGYGKLGELLPAALLCKGMGPKASDVSRGTGEPDGSDVAD